VSEKKDKNFWLNVLDGSIFGAASNMLPYVILLPAFIKKFTSNEYLINLIPAISIFGVAFPQIFIAKYVANLKYKKNIMLITGLFQRIPWLILAVLTFYYNYFNKTFFIFIFYLCFTICILTMGINIPAWIDLVAKVVPVKKRGELFAYREALGGIMGLGTTYLGRFILKNLDFPFNYSFLFFLFFVITSISLTFLIFIDEKSESKIMENKDLISYMKYTIKILKNDKLFLKYIFVIIILSLSAIAGGLITAYAIDQFSLQKKDFIFAQMSFINVIAKISFVFFIGWIADKYGHKINLVLEGLLMLIGFVLLLLFNHIVTIYIYFALSTIANSARIISNKNILLEFCSESQRATYISISNTISAPFSFIAPFIGSYVAKNYGYKSLFIVSIFLYLIYIIFTIILIKEPRKKIKFVNIDFK